MANILKKNDITTETKNCSADMLRFFAEFGHVETTTFLNNLLRDEQEYLAVELTYSRVEYKERAKALLFYFQATDLGTMHDYGEVVMYKKLPAVEERWKLPYMLRDLLSQLGAKSLKDLVLKGSDQKVIALLTHKVSKEGRSYVNIGLKPTDRALALKSALDALVKYENTYSYGVVRHRNGVPFGYKIYKYSEEDEDWDTVTMLPISNKRKGGAHYE